MASIASLAYDVYERRLLHRLTPDKIPQHIGVMCDGNRRWAKAFGEEVEGGYIAGADKIEEFLGWCDQLHVELVTLWLLSTDNLNRPGEEVGPLLRVIEDLVDDLAATRQVAQSCPSARSICCRPAPRSGSRLPPTRRPTSRV